MSDIQVEVVYALPERQYLRKVKLAEGSSVEQAIQASGLLELRQDIDLKSNKIGIYSRPAKLGDTLNDGDRSIATHLSRSRSATVSRMCGTVVRAVTAQSIRRTASPGW